MQQKKKPQTVWKIGKQNFKMKQPYAFADLTGAGMAEVLAS